MDVTLGVGFDDDDYVEHTVCEEGGVGGGI